MKPEHNAFLLLWEVPLRNYELRDDVAVAEPMASLFDTKDRGPGPWVVERQPRGMPREVRRYAPLAHETLHRDFAALHGKDDKAFYRFANKYGHLGHGQHLVVEGVARQPLLVGESLGMWRRECRELRQLLDLWDLTRSATGSAMAAAPDLRKCIVWDMGPPLSVSVEWSDRINAEVAEGEIIAWRARPEHDDLGKNAAALAMWMPGDPVAPAQFYVRDRVNRALHGEASPIVSPYGGSELAIRPHSLLAAFYVLFASELLGRVRDLRQCEHCRAYFYPARSDQRYCGVSCRKKADYRRKKEGAR